MINHDIAAIKVCLQLIVKGFTPEAETTVPAPSNEKHNGVPKAQAVPQSLFAYV
jgi:hypothetical protein